jgi:hypothetical protein
MPWRRMNGWVLNGPWWLVACTTYVGRYNLAGGRWAVASTLRQGVWMNQQCLFWVGARAEDAAVGGGSSVCVFSCTKPYVIEQGISAPRPLGCGACLLCHHRLGWHFKGATNQLSCASSLLGLAEEICSGYMCPQGKG